jgi:hypothetical protein
MALAIFIVPPPQASKPASQSITERLNRSENGQIPRQSGGFGFAKLNTFN